MIVHLGSSVYLTVGKKDNYPSIVIGKRKIIDGVLSVGSGVTLITGQFAAFCAIATDAYNCLSSKRCQSYDLSKHE